MKRGLRTLEEIAHFVRCIPALKCKIPPDILTPPDVVITMRGGQIFDKAILMASMFRACQYENYEEVDVAFKKE